MEFLVGTLTKKGGRGLARITVSSRSIYKQWEQPALAEPNYLIKNRAGTRFFATCEMERPDAQGNVGAVCEFVPQRRGVKVGRLFPVHGNEPCYLTLSPDEQTLYCANYTVGSVTMFPCTPRLGYPRQVISHHGVGADANGRQACPHCHQVLVTPDGQLMVADLGLDLLVLYTIGPQGALTESSRIQTPQGGGARHAVFLNDSTFYLAQEMGGLVSCFKKSGDTFTCVQTLPTTPGKEEHAVAAIRLSGDGSRLYVSNRMNNSLSEFLVDENGLLQLNREISVGPFPRDFLFLPGGGFLVACQGLHGDGGVMLLSSAGETLDFLPFPASVCLLPL